MEECPLRVRWVVGSIPHGGPMLDKRCNKGHARAMRHTVCVARIYITSSLLLLGKISPRKWRRLNSGAYTHTASGTRQR